MFVGEGMLEGEEVVAGTRLALHGWFCLFETGSCERGTFEYRLVINREHLRSCFFGRCCRSLLNEINLGRGAVEVL